MEQKEKSMATDETAKVHYRGWKAMPFVIGNETFEKLGTIGTLSNLLVYLTTVFNMKSIAATNLINIFNGTANFSTLLGAFLCDTYFGRYKTLVFATISSVLGLLALALTAAIPKLHPLPCGSEKSSTCPSANAWQMAFLLSAFGLLVIGGAGIRPCNLAFGADQFDPSTESGRMGTTSFFNWYYFTYTFAVLMSLTVIVYVQSDVSWAWGLAIPAILMFISLLLFFTGSRIFVKVKPEGSPLTSLLRVIVASIKKRKLTLHSQSQPCLSLFHYIPHSSLNSKLPSTNQFRFLDKAAIITAEDQINQDGSAVNPWGLCSIQQVEEVKCVVRILPIWASAMVYNIVIIQQQTYVVFQALQSNRRLGNTSFKIPAASYSIFNMIGLTIWIPFYDRVLVPRLRKITGKDGGITILQKMGFGMVLGIVTMIVSGIVETNRRNSALAKPIGFDPIRGAVSSMSGLWLAPQLILVGISEAFTVVALVEFYYKQFPENMRSVGGSFTFLGFAGSSYLSSFLISIVHRTTGGGDGNGGWLAQDLNKGKLDYFYYLVTALMGLNLCYFITCARWYKYKGSEDTVLAGDDEKVNSEKVTV